MRTEIRTVTPALAKIWLYQNKNNRAIRKHIVDNYAEQMKDGKWDLTGQGITFDENGDLIDGQHRLNAIIKSNTPVEMLIVWDAKKSYGYDCGLKRSYTDRILMKDGIKLDRFNVSAIRLAFILIHTIKSKKSGSITVENTSYSPSTEEIKNYYMKYEEYFDFISKSNTRRTSDTLHVDQSAPVRLAELCALYKYNDESAIKDWVEEVKTGFPVRNLRPAILYRNWELGNEKYFSDRVKRLKMAQLSLKKYIEGDDIKVLKQTSDFSLEIPIL